MKRVDIRGERDTDLNTELTPTLRESHQLLSWYVNQTDLTLLTPQVISSLSGRPSHLSPDILIDGDGDLRGVAGGEPGAEDRGAPGALAGPHPVEAGGEGGPGLHVTQLTRRRVLVGDHRAVPG